MNEEFQEIYKRYNHEIYYFILKLVGLRKDLAEELTQETLYQVFLSLHRYRGQCDIRTWIYQIAKNTCFKYFKKNPIHVSFEIEVLKEDFITDFISNPEECFLNQERIDILHQCLKKLKPKYRDVLTYRIYFELSFNQISKLIKISENSAKVIYHRGKDMLKKEMEVLYYGK